MSEKRDLDYYIDNPHEMPANLDDLEGDFSADEGAAAGAGDAAPTEKTGEESAASGASGGEKSAKTGENESGAEAAAAAAAADAAQQVIKSKNGKHEIPYSVLETERTQRQAAEQAAQRLQQQIDALQAQVAGKAAPAQAAAEAGPDLSEEDIAQISSDFPATGKVLKALLATVADLRTELTSVRQAESTRSTREATTTRSTVQEAIDGNEVLSYWQTKDPDMFRAAIGFDNQLKADPRNRSLSLEDRFAKVVSALEAVHGKTELPEEFRRTAAAPVPAPAGKAATNNVVALAEKAAAEAKPARVGSLSDIPGGVAPEADEITQLGGLSANDLGNKFMKMDMSQLSALLAKAA